MRLGIIGAGAIGEKHAAAAEQVGARVTRIVDKSPERAASLAAKHDAVADVDADTLWDDDALDAVAICVPNFLHHPLALKAMRAGKDVLLEKPMALSAIDCAELADVAEQSRRILQIGYTHRFTAVGSAAHDYISTGALGDIYHAKAHLHLRRGIPGLGGWFTNKALSGGGALIDLGVHLIDLVLYLLGQPRAVSVSGKAYSKFGVKMKDYVYESMWAGPPNYSGTFDVEDHATAMIVFDSGATLDLQVAWACNLPTGTAPDSMIAILGDRAGVAFELFGDHLLLRNQVAGRNADCKMSLAPAEQMELQMEDFMTAVRTRRPGIGATPLEGQKVQLIVDSIYESSNTNVPVEQ